MSDIKPPAATYNVQTTCSNCQVTNVIAVPKGIAWQTYFATITNPGKVPWINLQTCINCSCLNCLGK